MGSNAVPPIDINEMRRRLMLSPDAMFPSVPPQMPGAVNPMAPQAPQVSQPPQIPAPPPAPVPQGPGPAQQALEAALKQRPQENSPQFHQGRGRTILNA